MDRMSPRREPIRDDDATRLFQRALANWVGDLLRKRPRIEWPAADPAADFRDRDWKAMYAGSVLDD
jgi:hypothetical protein